MNDLRNRLAKKGVGAVGQNNGIIGGGLTAAGKQLPKGEQNIIKYFESREFTSKPGNHDHPAEGYGAPGQFAQAWGEAESNRLLNALVELDAESRRQGCK